MTAPGGRRDRRPIKLRVVWSALHSVLLKSSAAYDDCRYRRFLLREFAHVQDFHQPTAMAFTRSLLKSIPVVGRFATTATSREISEMGHIELRQMYKPTNFQRKALVWGRIFKNEVEIPERVSQLQMKLAYDRCRVKATNLLMIFGVVSSLLVIFDGQRRRQKRIAFADPNYHQK